MYGNDALQHGILLVDDEEFILWALEEYLRQCDFGNVLKASDGCECVEQVMNNGEKIALIVMDINMPRMDGLEALSTLREKFDGTIGVLFMTGYYTDAMLEEVRGEHEDRVMVLDLFQKPFNMEELKDAILKGVRTVVERRSQVA